MDNIQFTGSGKFKKAAIRPTEAGVYRADDVNEVKPSFYIIVEDSCIDDIRLKWLGNDGLYKFGTFSYFKTTSIKATKGEFINVINYSLSTAKAKKKLNSNIGQETWTLKKQQVPTYVYEFYKDLATSVKVYLNIGNLTTDKWIEVEVDFTPTIKSKNNFHNIELTINLPQQFGQTL